MRFWSEGLGERQLVMNLGKSHIRRLDEVMLLTGVVDSPAPWEYEVKLNRDDWAKILDTAATKEACGFLATRTTLSQLLAMAWSIAAFIVLLAWFRAIRLLGFHGAREAVTVSGQPAAVAAEPPLKKR